MQIQETPSLTDPRNGSIHAFGTYSLSSVDSQIAFDLVLMDDYLLLHPCTYWRLRQNFLEDEKMQRRKGFSNAWRTSEELFSFWEKCFSLFFSYFASSIALKKASAASMVRASNWTRIEIHVASFRISKLQKNVLNSSCFLKQRRWSTKLELSGSPFLGFMHTEQIITKFASLQFEVSLSPFWSLLESFSYVSLTWWTLRFSNSILNWFSCET